MNGNGRLRQIERLEVAAAVRTAAADPEAEARERCARYLRSMTAEEILAEPRARVTTLTRTLPPDDEPLTIPRRRLQIMMRSGIGPGPAPPVRP